MRFLFACAPTLALAAAACDTSGSAVHYKANCTTGEPSAEAKITAGHQSDGSVILPGGRRLTPAGRLLTIGGFPLAMRVLPGDRYVVVTDGADGDEYLRVVDTQATGVAPVVVSQLPYQATSETAQSPALFYGLALTKNGQKLYVSDGTFDGVPATEPDLTKHFNVIEVFSVTGTPPRLVKLPAEEIHLHFTTAGGSRIPAGIALSADEKTLYSVNQGDGSVSVIDLATAREVGTTPAIGLVPYDVVVDPARPTIYVSLWGGKKTNMPGVSAEGVVPIDVSVPAAPMPMPMPIPTGKAAEQMLLFGGKLYAAAADGDSISEIDLATNMSTRLPTAFDASGLFGSSPNALAIDSTAGRLYVANAGEDAVQVFDLASGGSLGRIPTAWYPTAVAVLADGTVLIASAKGLGGGPTDRAPGADFFAGTLQVRARPTATELMVGDMQVRENVTRPASYEVKLSCTGTPRAFPLPADRGGPTPIKYVFLIVRENKTYDTVLGDLPGSNGTPALAIFGADVTPNIHALAKTFVNFDNFYSNAEQSLQGHDWTTAGIINDYGEKIWLNTWGRHTRPTTAFGNAFNGLDHLTTPGSQAIWQLLDAAGTAYHNYGEPVNTGGAKAYLDPMYPGIFFSLKTLDVDKMDYVISNVKDPHFVLEPFSYVALPNDHTSGTAPGYPTPASMVADNDEATGRFIDALSHSRYWAQSAVFVIEDDPSDGGDHVEMHRSPCVVMSPWARRGYNSSVHYDNPSLWKTITLLLGVGPMNLYVENASAMYDAFSPTPDLTPYTYIPRKVPPAMNPGDAPLAAESARIDFSRPDTAPLGRILWKAMRGRDAEPPWGKTPLRGAAHDADD